MIIASIDIGSNTIILLIAYYNITTSQLTPILNEYRVPRISQGLTINGIINDDSLKKLMNGLDEFSMIINKLRPEIVLVNATNAFRIAKNGSVIKGLIEKRYSWNLNVISGGREAELTFWGIAIPSFSYDENILLIDIGGGSTEVIYGSISKILFKESFQLGIVSLLDRFINSDPPTSEELKSIRIEIGNIFVSAKEEIPAKQKALAVAGTPTTLASILMNVSTFEDELIENSELSKKYLSEFIFSISSMNSTEIKKKYGSLVEGREDLILIGTIILEGLMDSLLLEKIVVSTKGLRYGAIWEYLMSQNIYSIPAKNGIPLQK
jgi:exopolyphosphatase / guanosine-5'-triphosphate,3'-diphosphate pyrophosphatase